MTRIDWIALCLVVLLGVAGARRGLITSALSLTGVVVGAILGARLGPHLLSGGAHSPYTPFAALIGAAILAVLLQVAGAIAGSVLREGLGLTPFRTFDSVAGLLLGAAAGVGMVWVLGAVLLQLPGQTGLRRSAQRSFVLRSLNGIVPPADLLHALARVDPFPAIAGGPAAPTTPPDPRILELPGVRDAASSVVRVLGTACGLGVEGSGWVAAPDIVVTAAHVVAGESDTVVVPQGSSSSLSVQIVAFDSTNDVAVLSTSGLRAPPLRLVDPRYGDPVAILGYPENGPLDASPGRIGETSTVLSQDSYGHGPVSRSITSLAGRIRHGDSGGPAVNARGEVETTVFAARIGARSGYGVPASIVRRALAAARGPVSTGACA